MTRDPDPTGPPLDYVPVSRLDAPPIATKPFRFKPPTLRRSVYAAGCAAAFVAAYIASPAVVLFMIFALVGWWLLCKLFDPD